jgi:hypothetical protein
MPVLILLGLGLISLLLAHHQQQRLAAAQAHLRPAEQVHARLQRLHDLLNARMAPGATPARPLSETVPTVLAHLRDAGRYDVTIAAISSGPGGAVDGQEIDRLAAPLPGSLQLKQTRLRVTGRYRRYEGLLQYLDQLDTLPAAIDSIQVDRDQLVFSVEIYGT